MSKKQKALHVGIIMTEISHVFCCVLPLVFSLAGLLAGLGLVILLPDWLNGLHDAMHGFELATIIAAGVMLILGWAVHFYSVHNDCHEHGCSHQPCGPRKKAASKLLKAGTLLFVLNIIVFFFFHDGLERISSHDGHESAVSSYYDDPHDHGDPEAYHDEEAHGITHDSSAI